MYSKPLIPAKESKTPFASFVFGTLNAKLSTKRISPFLNFFDNTTQRALFLIPLFIFLAKTFSLDGPWVTPPPTQIGERLEPCLARPVPFCRQGFFPPPRTSPRSLLCATFLRL